MKHLPLAKYTADRRRMFLQEKMDVRSQRQIPAFPFALLVSLCQLQDAAGKQKLKRRKS